VSVPEANRMLEPNPTPHGHRASIWLRCPSQGSARPAALLRPIERFGLDGAAFDLFFDPASGALDSRFERQLRQYAQLGLPAVEVDRRLSIAAIQSLADLLLPGFEKSNGRRGLVSAGPLAAAGDDDGLASAAIELWQAVNRPNFISAIPCTEAGFQAFETCLDRGVNVELRSVLTLEEFDRARQLHRSALERLASAGQAVGHILAIIEIELSMIDRVVDDALAGAAATGGEPAERAGWLRGRAARATVDLVLAQLGADRADDGGGALQVRWSEPQPGATPDSRSGLLEQLLESPAICTLGEERLPLLETLESASLAPGFDLSVSRGLLEAVADLGIQPGSVLAAERERRSYEIQLAHRERLMELDKRLTVYREQLGEYGPALQRAASDIGSAGLNRRVWELEASAGREGPHWLDLPDLFEVRAAQDERRAEADAPGRPFEALIAAGDPGQLAVLRLIGALDAGEALDLRLLDGLNPGDCRAAVRGLAPERTGVLLLECGGDRFELELLEAFFRDWFIRGGVAEPDSHIHRLAALAPDEPGGGRVRRERQETHGAACLALGPDLAHAAVAAGLPVAPLLEGARDMLRRCAPAVPMEEHPGLYLAAVLAGLEQAGRARLTLLCDDPAQALLSWLAGLLESAGGPSPGDWSIYRAPPPSKHPANVQASTLFYLRVTGQFDARVQEAIERGIPAFVFPLDWDGRELGAAMMQWQFAVHARQALREEPRGATGRPDEAGRAIQDALKVWRRKGGFPSLLPLDGVDGLQLAGTANLKPEGDLSLGPLWATVVARGAASGKLRFNLFARLPARPAASLARLRRKLWAAQGLWPALDCGVVDRRGEDAGAVQVVISVVETEDIAPGKSGLSLNSLQRARARAALQLASGGGAPALHLELQHGRQLGPLFTALAGLLDKPGHDAGRSVAR